MVAILHFGSEFLKAGKVRYLYSGAAQVKNILPASLVMGRIYEFYLISGVNLSPNRCSNLGVSLRAQLFILTEENTRSAQ